MKVQAMKQELDFKKSFIRYISHELRTPLNTIASGLQFLQEALETIQNTDLEEHLHTVNEIKVSCTIAVETLNDLLTMDKIEDHKLKLEKNTLQAVNFVRDAVQPFHLQSRQQGVVLELFSEKDLDNTMKRILIDIDTNKISQIIRNLISNGLKFTPEGGTVTVNISHTEVEVEDVERGLDVDRKKTFSILTKISVTDTGVGLSMENQNKLFKEVIQFNPGKLQKGGGSGLGLYISHEIAVLHGGNLSVYSAGEGHGCTFTLTLPATLSDNGKPQNTNSNNSTVNDKENGIDRVECVDRSLRRISRLFSKSSIIMPDLNNIIEQGIGGNSSDNNNTNTNIITTTNNNNHHHTDNEFKGFPWEISSIKLDECASVDKPSQSQNVNKTTNIKSCKSHDSNNFQDYKDDDDRDAGICMTSSSTPTLSASLLSPSYSSKNPQLRMLLVDDSAANRKMISRLLVRRSSVLTTATDGMDALEIIRNNMATNEDPYDVILMDQEMPYMDGLQATLQIRAIGYEGLIIGLTGNIGDYYEGAFLAHGADAVLNKPLNIQLFDKLISNLHKSSTAANGLSSV